MNLLPAFLLRRIAHRPNLVKIFNNIGWLFLGKLGRLVVGLFVWVAIARYLGPEQFGLLNFALAFTGIFGALAVLGLPGIVVREIVRAPQNAEVILGTTAALHLAGGFVAVSLIYVTIAKLRPDDILAQSIVVVLSLIVLLKASEVSVYWFESQVRSKYVVGVQTAGVVMFAAASVILIAIEAPLMAFVVAMLVEAAVVASLLLVLMNAQGPPPRLLHVDIGRAKALLADSWPLVLASVAIVIYLRIDQVMLAQMVGDKAVGIYSAAARVSEVWYFVPGAIVASVFPAILNSRSRDSVQYYARLQRLYDSMVWLSVAIALPMTFLATPIMVRVFGVAYTEAGVILSIHIWASVFVFLGVASGRWLLAENRQMLSLQRSVLGLGTNVALNLALIPAYGPTGAALATVVSQMMASFVFDFLQMETRRTFFMKVAAMNPVRLFAAARRVCRTMRFGAGTTDR